MTLRTVKGHDLNFPSLIMQIYDEQRSHGWVCFSQHCPLPQLFFVVRVNGCLSVFQVDSEMSRAAERLRLLANHLDRPSAAIVSFHTVFYCGISSGVYWTECTKPQRRRTGLVAQAGICRHHRKRAGIQVQWPVRNISEQASTAVRLSLLIQQKLRSFRSLAHMSCKRVTACSILAADASYLLMVLQWWPEIVDSKHIFEDNQ